MDIKISQPKDDSLVAQLVSLYKIFKDVEFPEPHNFDVSRVSWFCPLFILPLSAHINYFGGKCYDKKNKAYHSYLDAIAFPRGVDSVSIFRQQTQSHRNYIPISVLKKERGAERERLESIFSTMIYKVLGSISGAQNAVHYPITELVTNIFEHSQQELGFIFGQFYPKKNYLDICIADCGRGLAQAYKDEQKLNLSDSDSIVEVMRGRSTKPTVERGYGVRTSKRVVCECLGGEFIFLSGSSALVASGKSQRIVELPNFHWQGVVVAYRIPKPHGPVDISPYLE